MSERAAVLREIGKPLGRLPANAAMPDDSLSLSPYRLFMDAKTLVACQYGSVIPARDFPLLLELWRAGTLPLERAIDPTRRAGGCQRGI